MLFKHPAPVFGYLVTATNTSGEAVRWFSNAMYRIWMSRRDTQVSSPMPVHRRRGLTGWSSCPIWQGRVRLTTTRRYGGLPGIGAVQRPAGHARSVTEGGLRASRLPGSASRGLGGTERANRGYPDFRRHRQESSLAPDHGGYSRCSVARAESDRIGNSWRGDECRSIGTGFYDSHEQAAHRMVAVSKVVETDPQNRATYAEGYERFRLDTRAPAECIDHRDAIVSSSRRPVAGPTSEDAPVSIVLGKYSAPTQP